ncbi:MAG: hypothetical protein QOF19_12 [Alphaproteobacteria bacterium]|nr:hypothetical protein [Alphaproteobacteria bacterium]
MRMLVGLLRELAGLFVDDGALALAILGVVALAAIFVALMPGASLLAGAVLLFGCLGVLILNTMRAPSR